MSLMSTAARYKCDECGVVSEWVEGWQWFGSIFMLDMRPDLLIHVCSNSCALKMQGKLDAGIVKQPEVLPKGPNDLKIKGRRVGY